MAARFKTKAYTLTGTPTSLSDIFASPHDEFANDISMRCPHTNSGNVTWEDSDGEHGGFMQPGEASGWDLAGKYVKLSAILLDGTSGDVVNITLLG